MDIRRLSLAGSIGLILGQRRLLTRGVELLIAAVSEFFVPQFVSRLFPGNRSVAVLSHPLDRALPFEPNQIRRYLGYITLWLKTLLYLYRCFGELALPDIEQMMRDLTRLYYTCGSVYRRCQSTTTSRPRCARELNPYFLLLHIFDPHLHCVPSLHILTVCYNYHKTGKIVGKLCPDGRLRSEAVEQTYQLALRITESVLLVKQHSLLDIGPSLFLLSRIFPDYGNGEIRRFVADLFAGNPGIEPGTRIRIREAILDNFREMLIRERRSGNANPTDVVVRFLEQY